MSDPPQILVGHSFPPETTGTLDEFTSRIQDNLPSANIYKSNNHQDTIDKLNSADIVIEHNFSEMVIAHANTVKWIHTLSSGADFYDLEAVQDLDAILTTVSGVHAKPIAEHVFAMILSFERNLPRIHKQQKRHEWNRFPPGELSEKTLGVIGVGNIGGRVAEIGHAFGMTVLGIRQNPSEKHEKIDTMYSSNNRHELLGKSDYVIICCPLTEKTKGLIGREELSSMEKSSVLINVARGEIIQNDPLIEQLQTGYIGGAALDVAETEPLPQDSPLWDMSNVIISPHMAGGSPYFPERCADIFIKNYNLFDKKSFGDMINRVI